MLLLSMLFYILNTRTLHIDFLSLAYLYTKFHNPLLLPPPHLNAYTNQLKLTHTCHPYPNDKYHVTPNPNYK
jgi:hypothetical protein